MQGKEIWTHLRKAKVTTIKVSAYISLKYVQIVEKKVGDLTNNTSKAIDIYHDQDEHNLVEYLWKCIVFGQNNTKLGGLRAKRWEEQIQDDV